MKKKLPIIIAIAATLVVCVTALYLYIPRTGTFTVDDYSFYIDYSAEFSIADTYFGPVHDKWTAAKIGSGFFKETYGKSKHPITVLYDAENDIWCVHDHFWPGLFHHKKGGSAYVIINASDGKLVAMWHGK